MKSIEEFPQEWIEYINEVKTTDPKYLSSIMELCTILIKYEELKELLNKKVQIKLKTTNRVKPSEMMNFISRYFLSHQYQLGLSVFELAKSGYGNSMTILVRSLLENLINLSYLWLTKIINNGSDKERMAWYQYYDSHKINIHEKLIDFFKYREKIGKPVEDSILASIGEEDLKKFKHLQCEYLEHYSEFNHGKEWSKHKQLDRRAREVDATDKLEGIYLEAEYIIVYKTSSQLVHGTSGIMSLYTELDTQDISFGGDFNSGKYSLSLASKYLEFSLNIIAKISNVKLEY